MPTTAKARPKPPEATADETHPNATRAAAIRSVPLGQMNVAPAAQRKFFPKHAQDMADDFDLEGMGYPVLNYRDGTWWIVDGQHRVAALRILGFADEDVIECECFVGLTEKEEADLFLRRAKSKPIHSGDKFRISVNADREDEVAIQKIVTDLGLKVGIGSGNNIQAVGALGKVYREAGATVLGRTLLIIREAYGDRAFTATLIGGIGLLLHRYGNNVDSARLIGAMKKASGGVEAIEQSANQLRRSLGGSKPAAAAGALVQLYNKSRGKKLPDWWKSQAAA
jgi:hypothetical protein